MQGKANGITQYSQVIIELNYPEWARTCTYTCTYVNVRALSVMQFFSLLSGVLAARSDGVHQLWWVEFTYLQLKDHSAWLWSLCMYVHVHVCTCTCTLKKHCHVETRQVSDPWTVTVRVHATYIHVHGVYKAGCCARQVTRIPCWWELISLKQPLYKDCWLVWPHHDSVFSYTHNVCIGVFELSQLSCLSSSGGRASHLQCTCRMRDVWVWIPPGCSSFFGKGCLRSCIVLVLSEQSTHVCMHKEKSNDICTCMHVHVHPITWPLSPLSRRVSSTELWPLLQSSQLSRSRCLLYQGPLHGLGWALVLLPASPG